MKLLAMCDAMGDVLHLARTQALHEVVLNAVVQCRPMPANADQHRPMPANASSLDAHAHMRE